MDLRRFISFGGSFLSRTDLDSSKAREEFALLVDTAPHVLGVSAFELAREAGSRISTWFHWRNGRNLPVVDERVFVVSLLTKRAKRLQRKRARVPEIDSLVGSG